jgi:diguanylate cyclase (GGDEF)-like protein
MSELAKICVIYQDNPPQLTTDSAGAPSWSLEFIDAAKISSGPVAPRSDFIAVFCPAGDEILELPERAAYLFPGAVLVSYLDAEAPRGPAASSGSFLLPTVHLPMPARFAHNLLNTLVSAGNSRHELASLKTRVSEIQDMFDAFVNIVEGTYGGSDRKLEITLLIDAIRARVDAQECMIYFTESDSDAVHRGYCTGWMRDIDLFEHHANNSIIERVLNSGELYLDNNHGFEIKVPFSKESLDIHSILCVPLQSGSETIGVLELLNKNGGRGFTSHDQDLVRSLAKPLAVAVKNILAFERAERLVSTDDLTKLYNYRYLMKYLRAEIKRCLRYKKKVSLLFVDIDGFKRINDTFGHLVGSQALSEMGQVIRKSLRDTDVIARYGGDEFVIVLPETTLKGAVVIAERIRKKVEEFEFAAHNLNIRLTVSLGVANSPKHTLTAEGLIKKADVAMYQAKELSRNTIKVAV